MLQAFWTFAIQQVSASRFLVILLYLVADCGCFPAYAQGNQGGSTVVAIDQARSCGSASWLAVGLSGGHAALADPRAGELGAFWRTHDAGLTCLAACSDHSVLTGSQVRAVTCTLERASS